MPKPADAARPTRQDLKPSPALSIIKNGPRASPAARSACWSPTASMPTLLAALEQGARRRKGRCSSSSRRRSAASRRATAPGIDADEKLDGGPSVLFDAVAILPSEEGAALLATLPAARDFVADAFAHRKFIAYVDAAEPLLEKAGVPSLDEGFVPLKIRRRLRRLRRRLPQASLLGPGGRRAISRRIVARKRSARTIGIASCSASSGLSCRITEDVTRRSSTSPSSARAPGGPGHPRGGHPELGRAAAPVCGTAHSRRPCARLSRRSGVDRRGAK